jgi:iron(III) transport system ATP-binding protein
MSAIELRGVAKRFGSTPVLRQLDLSVPERSITAVLGPSGSGKTTLLRVVAGFEKLDSGEVTLAGRVVDDGRRSVRPQQRGIGYVPQEGALFPHLTVLGNIAFGLPRSQRSRAHDLAAVVGLGKLHDRYPHQLSGGQQQRVALARALAIGPEVVLLDEPFGALDVSLRVELREDVTHILKQAGTTAILVTHDQDEALAMADKIALIVDGQTVAQAPPRLLYQNPPDRSTARSIGLANILPAQIQSSHAVCALGPIAINNIDAPINGQCELLLRPEQLALHPQQQSHTTPAEIQRLRYHGHETLVHLHLPDSYNQPLIARLPGAPTFQIGQTVWVEVTGTGVTWPGPAGSSNPRDSATAKPPTAKTEA